MTPASQEWIERLKGDNEQRDHALAELRKLILQRLRKAFQDRPDLSSNFVEDIAQESLIKVLNHLDSFEGRSLFTTWATTIAIRTAFSELRRKLWKNVSLEQVLAGGNHPKALRSDSEIAHEPACEKSDMVAAMYEVIHQKLTLKQRDALLAELQGMPLEEIARHTKSSRNAVYKLTHDARKRLKRCLEESGFTNADLQSMRT